MKLRLLRCVKDFLIAQGNEDKFFGADARGFAEGLDRTMIWPAQENEVIAAVTPLLRRMVTNERQRQYAVETRKTENIDGCDKRRKLNDSHNPTRQGRSQDALGACFLQSQSTLIEQFNKINGDYSAVSWDRLMEYCASPNSMS